MLGSNPSRDSRAWAALNDALGEADRSASPLSLLNRYHHQKNKEDIFMNDRKYKEEVQIAFTLWKLLGQLILIRFQDETNCGIHMVCPDHEKSTKNW